MVAKIVEMTGQRFGLLKVLHMHPHRNHFRQAMWVCQCDCGEIANFCGSILRIGGHVHCGKCPHRTLGYSRSVIRLAWLEMLTYRDQVYIDPRWLESIIEFANDVGERPGQNFVLHRIDSNRAFVKENMKWHDCQVRMPRRVFKFMGRKLTAAQLARELGISRQALSMGLRRGWTVTQMERRYLKQQAEEAAKTQPPPMTNSQLARKVGITQTAVAGRLARGLTIDQVIAAGKRSNARKQKEINEKQNYTTPTSGAH